MRNALTAFSAAALCVLASCGGVSGEGGPAVLPPQFGTLVVANLSTCDNKYIYAAGKLDGKPVIGMAGISGTNLDPVIQLVPIINGSATIPLYGYGLNLVSHVMSGDDELICVISTAEQSKLSVLTINGIKTFDSGSFDSSKKIMVNW